MAFCMVATGFLMIVAVAVLTLFRKHEPVLPEDEKHSLL